MTVLVSLASVCVAAAAAYIAWAQFQLARRKVRFELFEKRYPLFELLWSYLSAHVMNPDEVKDIEPKIRSEQHKYMFLFDQSVHDYVRMVRNESVQVGILRTTVANTFAPADRLERAHKELGEKNLWFAEQVDGLQARFKPYLHFEEWSGLPLWLERLKR